MFIGLCETSLMLKSISQQELHKETLQLYGQRGRWMQRKNQHRLGSPEPKRQARRRQNWHQALLLYRWNCHPSCLPATPLPAPTWNNMSWREPCASKMGLQGAPGREKRAAGISAHSTLHAETLQDRNKIFTPCEGGGSWEPWPHKPLRRRTPQGFCGNQQLPDSMTLDSPTYFVFDNLILYCNNLHYTAALDLCAYLRTRRS